MSIPFETRISYQDRTLDVFVYYVFDLHAFPGSRDEPADAPLDIQRITDEYGNDWMHKLTEGQIDDIAQQIYDEQWLR